MFLSDNYLKEILRSIGAPSTGEIVFDALRANEKNVLVLHVCVFVVKLWMRVYRMLVEVLN